MTIYTVNIKFCLFVIIPKPCTVITLLKFARYVMRCFPVWLSLSKCPQWISNVPNLFPSLFAKKKASNIQFIVLKKHNSDHSSLFYILGSPRWFIGKKRGRGIAPTNHPLVYFTIQTVINFKRCYTRCHEGMKVYTIQTLRTIRNTGIIKAPRRRIQHQL